MTEKVDGVGHPWMMSGIPYRNGHTWNPCRTLAGSSKPERKLTHWIWPTFRYCHWIYDQLTWISNFRRTGNLPVQEKCLESPNGDGGSDKENVPPKSTTVAIVAEGEFNLSMDDLQPGCIIQFVDSNMNPLADVDVEVPPPLSPGVSRPLSAHTPVALDASPTTPVSTAAGSGRGVPQSDSTSGGQCQPPTPNQHSANPGRGVNQNGPSSDGQCRLRWLRYVNVLLAN